MSYVYLNILAYSRNISVNCVHLHPTTYERTYLHVVLTHLLTHLIVLTHGSLTLLLTLTREVARGLLPNAERRAAERRSVWRRGGEARFLDGGDGPERVRCRRVTYGKRDKPHEGTTLYIP